MSRAEIDLPRHRLSVDDYYKMAEVGILGPDARVELIEGEIIDMPPMGSLHAWVVTDLYQRLTKALGDAAVVRSQLPVSLGNRSEPEPDLAVVRPSREYVRRHPCADDVLLLVETCDTSARYDRAVKVPLYARHGIKEVWLVDLPPKQLRVFEDAQDGEYTRVSTVELNSAVASRSLEALPSIAVSLAGLLPRDN